MNYKRNAKYFRPVPSIKTIAILVVIALILLAINAGLGIIAIVIVGVLGYLMYGGKPSDREIDQIADEELAGIKALAVKKLGVEEEELSYAEPIQFRGWDFYDEKKGTRVLADEKLQSATCVDRCGKDGYWRAPIISCYFFAFSENMVHFYYRHRSMVSDSVKEGTDEFFYKDVVNARTETEDRPGWNPRTKMEDPKIRVRFDSFMLATSGGTSVECSVRDSDTADASVNAMRALLKQKKMQQ